MRKVDDKAIPHLPGKTSLFRLDSTFENANDSNEKEFAARFVRRFTTPQILPPPQPFAALEKTYPSKKIRYVDDSCNKG